MDTTSAAALFRAAALVLLEPELESRRGEFLRREFGRDGVRQKWSYRTP